MRVTVVVPTYRRPQLLARCLAALDAQTLAASDYEVLVCDDADNPSTRAQVEERARTARARVRYCAVVGTHGPAAARNVGWRSAAGDIIAFTDDDTIPDPNWLSAGLAAFGRDDKLAAITGRVEVPLPAAPTDYERNESGLERAEFVTANCFVRRAVLDQVGGFDERFASAWREDSDLHFTLLERGLGVAREASAVVVHPVRPAAWGVSLRQQRKSQYDALLYKKHPALYRERVGAVAPLSFYAVVAALAAVPILAVAGLSIAAGVAAGVWALLTLRFCASRLRGNSKSLRHVAEMAVTSSLIPPLSLFWRAHGGVKFGVVFW